MSIMKRTTKILATTFLLAFIFSVSPAISQEPPHPPSSGHGMTGNVPGGPSAPIDGGLSILLALGAAYGFRKVRKNNNE